MESNGWKKLFACFDISLWEFVAMEDSGFDNDDDCFLVNDDRELLNWATFWLRKRMLAKTKKMMEKTCGSDL